MPGEAELLAARHVSVVLDTWIGSAFVEAVQLYGRIPARLQKGRAHQAEASPGTSVVVDLVPPDGSVDEAMEELTIRGPEPASLAWLWDHLPDAGRDGLVLCWGFDLADAESMGLAATLLQAVSVEQGTRRALLWDRRGACLRAWDGNRWASATEGERTEAGDPDSPAIPPALVRTVREALPEGLGRLWSLRRRANTIGAGAERRLRELLDGRALHRLVVPPVGPGVPPPACRDPERQVPWLAVVDEPVCALVGARRPLGRPVLNYLALRDLVSGHLPLVVPLSWLADQTEWDEEALFALGVRHTCSETASTSPEVPESLARDLVELWRVGAGVGLYLDDLGALRAEGQARIARLLQESAAFGRRVLVSLDGADLHRLPAGIPAYLLPEPWRGRIAEIGGAAAGIEEAGIEPPPRALLVGLSRREGGLPEQPLDLLDGLVAEGLDRACEEGGWSEAEAREALDGFLEELAADALFDPGGPQGTVIAEGPGAVVGVPPALAPTWDRPRPLARALGASGLLEGPIGKPDPDGERPRGWYRFTSRLLQEHLAARWLARQYPEVRLPAGRGRMDEGGPPAWKLAFLDPRLREGYLLPLFVGLLVRDRQVAPDAVLGTLPEEWTLGRLRLLLRCLPFLRPREQDDLVADVPYGTLEAVLLGTEAFATEVLEDVARGGPRAAALLAPVRRHLRRHGAETGRSPAVEAAADPPTVAELVKAVRAEGPSDDQLVHVPAIRALVRAAGLPLPRTLLSLVLGDRGALLWGGGWEDWEEGLKDATLPGLELDGRERVRVLGVPEGDGPGSWAWSSGAVELSFEEEPAVEVPARGGLPTSQNGLAVLRALRRLPAEPVGVPGACLDACVGSLGRKLPWVRAETRRDLARAAVAGTLLELLLTARLAHSGSMAALVAGHEGADVAEDWLGEAAWLAALHAGLAREPEEDDARSLEEAAELAERMGVGDLPAREAAVAATARYLKLVSDVLSVGGRPPPWVEPTARAIYLSRSRLPDGLRFTRAPLAWLLRLAQCLAGALEPLPDGPWLLTGGLRLEGCAPAEPGGGLRLEEEVTFRELGGVVGEACALHEAGRRLEQLLVDDERLPRLRWWANQRSRAVELERRLPPEEAAAAEEAPEPEGDEESESPEPAVGSALVRELVALLAGAYRTGTKERARWRARLRPLVRDAVRREGRTPGDDEFSDELLVRAVSRVAIGAKDEWSDEIVRRLLAFTTLDDPKRLGVQALPLLGDLIHQCRPETQVQVVERVSTLARDKHVPLMLLLKALAGLVGIAADLVPRERNRVVRVARRVAEKVKPDAEEEVLGALAGLLVRAASSLLDRSVRRWAVVELKELLALDRHWPGRAAVRRNLPRYVRLA